MAEESCSYSGLRLPARILVSIANDTDRNRFLVGTVSLRETNEIHLIEYMEDSNEFVCEKIFNHSNEVWDLASCPSDSQLFTSCDATDTATLWRIPGGDDDDDDNTTTTTTTKAESATLEKVMALPGHQGVAKCVLWDPTGKTDSIVTIDDCNVRHWHIESGWTTNKTPTVISVENPLKLSGGCWNPHHIHVVAASCDRAVKSWDLRSSKAAFSIEGAHAAVIRDLEFNPNKPNVIATCGDDRALKIWDTRHTAKPTVTMVSHSHWVWNIAYNRNHDLLMLSCGTDFLVNLWCLPSTSSTPAAAGESQDEAHQNTDVGTDRLVSSIRQHDDSVYSVAWSSANSFSFASLSYDGRVYVNHVPQALKYSILL